MPLYEVNLILRTVTKAQCTVALKRVAEAIINEGAILRKMEMIGLDRSLPYSMTKDNKRYKRGSFFLCKYHGHPDFKKQLSEIYDRDIDVIRCFFARVVEPEGVECTLHEELLPPAYRPEVQKMIADDREKRIQISYGRNRRFNMNVDTYVFQ